jgi:hypothetical protein
MEAFCITDTLCMCRPHIVVQVSVVSVVSIVSVSFLLVSFHKISSQVFSGKQDVGFPVSQLPGFGLVSASFFGFLG